MSRSQAPKHARNWFRFQVAFILFWAGLIFATSCTVVSMDQLFAAVESVFGRKLLERFEVFWGIAWFAVVKSWHATEFAILTAALVLLLNSWRPSHKRRNALTAGIIAVIFAASDEFHQTFVPSREGTILDVLIDSLGVGAVTLFNWIKNRELAIDNSTPRTIG